MLYFSAIYMKDPKRIHGVHDMNAQENWKIYFCECDMRKKNQRNTETCKCIAIYPFIFASFLSFLFNFVSNLFFVFWTDLISFHFMSSRFVAVLLRAMEAFIFNSNDVSNIQCAHFLRYRVYKIN